MSKEFLVLLFLAGCATTATNKISIPSDTVSFAKDAWVISFSPNMPTHPAASGNGWYFDFPSKDGVHYVLVPYHANKPHTTLTITYRVTGSGKFVSVDAPCRGAGFSPMLERAGDMMSASQEFYRFWGAQTLLVADGQIHTVTFPLTWQKWTGVSGKSNQAGFDDAMKNLMAVGITYGGCYAGHGTYVIGKAIFELLDFQIQ